MRRILCFSITTTILLAGCSAETVVYADRPLCPAGLQLTATTGATPSFDWNDGCRVWSLRIERVETSAVVWSVGKDDESLDGPVVYGQLPAGAGELAAAQTLQPGIAYRAVLVQRSEGGRILAETAFTP